LSVIPFAVVGTQRTGTTVIRTLLDSHPEVRCIGEAFLMSWPGETGYAAFLRKNFARRIRHFVDRRALTGEYLDRLFAAPRVRASGFKLMHSQFRRFPSVVTELRERGGRAIHIVRGNVLKTLISREVARANKLYHTEKQVRLQRIRLNPRTLLRRLDRIDGENRAWTRLLRGIPHHRTLYEAFQRDNAGELQKLLRFLGVDPTPDLTSPFVKMSPDRMADIVENYDVVKRRLRGTAYERCLDPE
jgi:hypothetical protein